MGALPAVLSSSASTFSSVSGGWLSKLANYRLGLIIALSPTLLASVYFTFVASNIYVSEATFVLRSSSGTSVSSGFSGFLKLAGISTSQNETYAVHEFVTSRDALGQLSKDLDLRALYGRPEADFLTRYPNLIYGGSDEDFARYMSGRIKVHLNPNTGMSLLQVQAFTPEDTQQIATRLLELSEILVNDLNERIRRDAIRVAEEEVQRAKERLQEAQVNLTYFRNSEALIDPNESSLIVTELIASLSEQLTRIETEITETVANSPDGPQLVTLQLRAAALREQIKQQRERFTENSEGLARKIEQFERLRLEQDVATKVLSSAIISLEDARSEARRKQQYLERVSSPQLPDKAAEPTRLFNIASIAGLNLIVLLLIWLMRTGIAEHAPGRKVFVQ